MEECEAKIKKADTRATQTAEGRHKALVEKNKAIDAIGRAKQSKTEIEARRDAQQTHTDDLAREASEHYDRVAVEEGLTIEIIDARLARIKRDHQNAESRSATYTLSLDLEVRTDMTQGWRKPRTDLPSMASNQGST